jgi:hypothetical protein
MTRSGLDAPNPKRGGEAYKATASRLHSTFGRARRPLRHYSSHGLDLSAPHSQMSRLPCIELALDKDVRAVVFRRTLHPEAILRKPSLVVLAVQVERVSLEFVPVEADYPHVLAIEVIWPCNKLNHRHVQRLVHSRSGGRRNCLLGPRAGDARKRRRHRQVAREPVPDKAEAQNRAPHQRENEGPLALHFRWSREGAALSFRLNDLKPLLLSASSAFIRGSVFGVHPRSAVGTARGQREALGGALSRGW